MKTVKSHRFRVFILAACILVLSTAVLIISVNMTMGAEEDRTIEEAALNAAPANDAPANAAPASAETTEAELTPTPAPIESSDASIETTTISPHPASIDSPMETMAPTPTPEPVQSPSPEPSQQLINDNDAVNACVRVMAAANILKPDADRTDIKVYFGDRHDVNDTKRNINYKLNDVWYVDSPCFFASVDVVSGEILMLEVRPDKCPKGTITLEEYNNGEPIGFKDGVFTDLHNSPDDKYIKTAVQIVSGYVTDGREIENVEIGATQFVWDNNLAGFDPDATGTVQVDCQVYMKTGRSYTLHFWGTDEIVLKDFWSHPTKHACMWGYFYEEDAADYPPEGGDWKDVSGVTEGQYSVPSPGPSGVTGS